MEARFAALAQPGGLDRPVECRGRICRVSSGDVDHDRFDAAIRQLTKTAHLNGEELQSRQWPHREIIVYLDFMTDEMATAVDKVGGLGAALRASRPFAACKEQYADRGEVRLTIMSGPPRHLPVESSGGLAATPIGECLRNAMAGLASSLEFAPSVTTVPVHMTFIMRID